MMGSVSFGIIIKKNMIIVRVILVNNVHCMVCLLKDLIICEITISVFACFEENSSTVLAAGYISTGIIPHGNNNIPSFTS